MTNSDDIQAAAELLLYGQRVKMASTVPVACSASIPLHSHNSPPTSPPHPAPRPDAHRPTFRPETTICEWPWRGWRAGCGRSLRQVVVASAVPAVPAVLVVLGPVATGTALRCRATACQPQGHPVLCGSPWPRLRADWYLAAHRGLALELVDAKLTDPL